MAVQTLKLTIQVVLILKQQKMQTDLFVYLVHGTLYMDQKNILTYIGCKASLPPCGAPWIE